MTVQQLFEFLATELPQAGVRYLLIGGFAVNHYGYTRNTLDVDLMVAAEQSDSVRLLMRAAGFTNVAVHDTVTFFNMPGSAWRVDVLQVDSQTMDKLLAHATPSAIQGKVLKVPALRDLLAMKFFALSQAFATRADKDLPDIAYLAVLNGLDVERDLHPLARRYANEEIFEKVCQKIGALQA